MSNALNEGSLNFIAAVPSDSTVLPAKRIRGIHCHASGNLVATNASGADITIAMVAGQEIQIKPTKIKAATTGSYVILL